MKCLAELLCTIFWHKSDTGWVYDEDVRCDRCWKSIFVDRDWYRVEDEQKLD